MRTSKLARRSRRGPARRVLALTRLGHELREAHHDVDKILVALARSLTTDLCDGYAIALTEIEGLVVPPHRVDPRDEALASIGALAALGTHTFDSDEHARALLPADYASYIERYGLRDLVLRPLAGDTFVRGTVTVTRDRDSPPFDPEDLAAIDACIVYASLAAENALQLDIERAAMRVERERTSRFKQEIIGIVGHDLQGPLGAIILATEMLALERQAELGGQVVARIGSFARRMTRMVEQLLDLTRARLGGGIPLARTNMHVLPLVKSAMVASALLHPTHRFELREAVDATGLWDPDRISQVTSYLLDNAVYYGMEGAPIHVGVMYDDGAVTITVHNELSGAPIPPDVRASLFEPRRREGTGLDLYIVYEIIRAHGGSIAVKSSRAGTTFEVVLPGGTATTV